MIAFSICLLEKRHTSMYTNTMATCLEHVQCTPRQWLHAQSSRNRVAQFAWINGRIMNDCRPKVNARHNSPLNLLTSALNSCYLFPDSSFYYCWLKRSWNLSRLLSIIIVFRWFLFISTFSVFLKSLNNYSFEGLT